MFERAAIWKFPVELVDEQVIVMPAPGQPLHFGEQEGRLWLWALVDPAQEPTPHRFVLVGTGHPVPAHAQHYVGTIHVNIFVWHLYTADRPT